MTHLGTRNIKPLEYLETVLKHFVTSSDIYILSVHGPFFQTEESLHRSDVCKTILSHIQRNFLS